MTNLASIIREDVTRYFAECGALADKECRICRGTGKTTGCVSPGCYATYPCPCTGRRL